MRLPRHQPGPAQETTIPLVNVAFLLLAFFMLVGRMDATAPFAVLPPQSAVGTPLPQGGATVSIARSGVLALDGVEKSLAEIVVGLRETGPELVRLNADGGALLADVLPVAAALEAAGGLRVVLVVTPSEPGGR